MFINCPNCGTLVATDLATDLPPERCPRCGFGLLAEPATEAAPAPDATSAPAAAAPLAPLSPVPAPPPPNTTGPITPSTIFIPLRRSRPAAVQATAEEAAASTSPTHLKPVQPASAPTRSMTGADAAADTTETDGAAAPRADAEDTPASPTLAAGDAAAPPAIDLETTVEPETDGPIGAPPRQQHGQAPRFLRGGAGPDNARPGWRPVAAAVALAMLLVLQLLLADRARLAADTNWRPVVASLCDALRCSLPPWREPAAIAVQQRDVRPLPAQPGVLRVSATIRNDARWPQAWPQLTLTLSDVDGRALGMRVFEPDEYLAEAPAGPALSSGQSATIRMDIVEPSPHAVAFNFRFH